MRIELAEVLTLARSSASLELQRRHASDPQVPEEYDSTGVVHMALPFGWGWVDPAVGRAAVRWFGWGWVDPAVSRAAVR